jgi:hypothetical protein
MAITSVGAIFSTQSKLLQRIYIPSLEDSEISAQFVGNGETMTLIPISIHQLGGSAGVQAAIGAPTFSGRCAVVDGTNTVIDLIVADPAIYADPRGTTIAHDSAQIGDSWDGIKFSRRYAEYDPATMIVVAVGPQPIDNPVPTIPTDKLVVSRTLQIGQKVPTKATAGV